MQRSVVDVAVRQEVVEEHGAAFARVERERRLGHLRLREERLSAEVGLVEVQEERRETRALLVGAPVVVRVVPEVIFKMRKLQK